MESVPFLLEGVRALQSQHLKVIEAMIGEWTREDGESRLEDFHRALARAYKAQDEEEIKRHLASYLVCFAQVLSTMPVFINEEDTFILYRHEEMNHTG